MNEKDIKWAREAGLAPICSACDEPNFNYAYADWAEELETFAALVRADEREACAKLVEHYRSDRDMAEVIRARSQA